MSFRRNPAFKASLAALPGTLAALDTKDRQRILSVRPLGDGIVPVPDTHISGAQETLIPTVGHAFSIFYALTFGSPRIMQFIKK